MITRTLEHGARSCLLLLSVCALGNAQAQDETKVGDLEKKVDGLEAQIKELREQQDQGLADVDETFDEMDEQMRGLANTVSGITPGKRKFLITGYAFGGYHNAEGEDSSFFAGFAPIFLWKVSDNVFMEAEIEFELEDDETHTHLEYAQLSYILNDYAILGLGKFLSPSNPFAERLHPAWINKLPDAPLALGERRLMPFTQMGMQIHGGVPVGSQKLTYALYLSNGTSLDEEDVSYGQLSDANYSDLNNNKAVGGRVGYFPVPELEIGYSIEFSQVTASESETADADALVQSVDLNHVATLGMGTFDLRAQWVFSDVDSVVIDPNGSGGVGPVTLQNKRNGGYIQAAFRPSEMESEFLSKLEGVVRYDQVDLPTGAPEGTDQSRVTIGVNYWTSGSSVFKLAYRFDDVDGPGESADALLFQWAIGF